MKIEGSFDFLPSCVSMKVTVTNVSSFLMINPQRHFSFLRWYTVNGLLMIISFAVCRILVFPYMYLAYGAQYGLSIPQVVRKIPVHCNLGSLMVLLPQVHWLRLMMLGALKVSKGVPITDSDEKID